jgi:hypothetical protein
MIEGPRRSVTRFFVPLIDVLILLFCIFLLMPFVSQPGNLEGGGDPASKRFDGKDAEPLPTDTAKLREELQKALAELKKLKENQGSISERLNVRVLEIDPKTGRLFYFVENERREVRNELDAQRLIDEHLRASAPGKKEAFFLILYPRVVSGYPEQQQVDNYRKWFRSVAIGFDNPLTSSSP